MAISSFPSHDRAAAHHGGSQRLHRPARGPGRPQAHSRLFDAAYAIFGTAPLWLDSLPQIFASRVLLGATEAALMTVSSSMIGDYFCG